MAWLDGWSFCKLAEVQRAAGDITDFQMDLYVGESANASWMLTACESTSGWFATHNSTITTDTGAVGTCVKITGTAADSGAYYYPMETLDLRSVQSLKFYSKRSAGATSQLYLFMGGSSSNWVGYTYTNTTDFVEQTINLADYISSSGPIDFSKVYMFRFDVDGNGANLWIDEVRFIPKVHLQGFVKTDFSDLRFANEDDELLNYYIHELSGTTPNQAALVTVKIDSILSTPKYMKMYFGNPDAVSLSSGANTFIIFDDFERGANGDAIGGGWTVAGTAQISTEQKYKGTRSGKILGIGTSATTQIYQALTAANQEYQIAFKFFKENACNRLVFLHGNGTNGMYAYVNATEDIYYYSSSHVDTGVNTAADAWRTVEINNFNFTSKIYDFYVAGVIAKLSTPMFTQNWFTQSFGMQNFNSASGNDFYIDNVIVRKWSPILPVINSWSGIYTLDKDRYWVGGSGDYNDISHWSNQSGGSGGYSVPDYTNNVIFDENSFTAETGFLRI